MFVVNIDSLEYKTNPPGEKAKRKIGNVIETGRPIEVFNNKSRPDVITSWIYYDNFSYVILSNDRKKVLGYRFNLSKKIKREVTKPLKIEQHCFDQISQRKISIASMIECMKRGISINQWHVDRKGKLYQNRSFLFEDMRVVISIFDDHLRVKTAYRMTDVHDANLIDKLKKREEEAQHEYAIVNLDKLYRSPILAGSSDYCNLQSNNLTRRDHYRASWELLGNTLGIYGHVTYDEELYPEKSNTLLNVNQKIVESAIVCSSLQKYKDKSFSQKDFDPSAEYALVFLFEQKAEMKKLKKVYGLGMSAKLTYSDQKSNPKTNKQIFIAGASLTESSGFEWIRDTNRQKSHDERCIYYEPIACNT